MYRVMRVPAALKAATRSLKSTGSFSYRKIVTSNKSIKRMIIPSVTSNFRYFSGTKSSTASKVQTMEFQAETRKLLDIVTNSIYTDKEVFIRELISNASDALEKFRYKQVLGAIAAGGDGSNVNQPLEIIIVTDAENNTLTLSDNGIGMTREELISNLGTIARSGSKQFVENLKNTSGESGNASSSGSNGDGIIGQFGVGFYSSFMVSDTVTVESMPAALVDSEGQVQTLDPSKWSSDGSGMFTIEDSVDNDLKERGRGSKIVMQLKESCKEFSQEEKIKSIIKRYSNFVAFPIKLNGETVNTVSAIWTQDKKNVTKAQYDEFYKYIANAFDSPQFTLHFKADAPIDLKCLLYVPSFHSEKFGRGRLEPGVNLYSRKILIENKPKDLLPDWLRFIKGVVDSEDLPLSLSREKSQDSTLLKRIRDVLTRKLIRFFDEQARNHPEEYRQFYNEYSVFIKEGICHDYQFTDQLAKLLLFESSTKADGDLTSLDDYISRCAPEQKQIYYLVAPTREAAMTSPYIEVFQRHDKEVLLLFNSIDDFVMSNVKNFAGRELISAESSAVNLGPLAMKEDKKKEGEKNGDAGSEGKSKSVESNKLSEAEIAVLCDWMKNTLGPSKVTNVKTTDRLNDSPAIITDHESGAVRRMLKMLNQSNVGTKTMDQPPQVLEINPSHKMIIALAQAEREGGNRSEVATLAAQQILDNALIAAGLVDDPRMMLSRLNEIIFAALTKQ